MFSFCCLRVETPRPPNPQASSESWLTTSYHRLYLPGCFTDTAIRGKILELGTVSHKKTHPSHAGPYHQHQHSTLWCLTLQKWAFCFYMVTQRGHNDWLPKGMASQIPHLADTVKGGGPLNSHVIISGLEETQRKTQKHQEQ